MKRRPYIRRDKLIKELKDIYNDLYQYSKILENRPDRGAVDISFLFTLKNLHDEIEKLQGTYKTLEEQLQEIAIKHLNDEPEAKVVEYTFEPAYLLGNKKDEEQH